MFQSDTMIPVRRTISYPGSGSLFYLPQPVWEKSLDTLRWYGNYNSEGLVYWGGVIGAAREILVTSLLLLNHAPQGGCVQPSDEEMRALLRTLRVRDEKLVAQVHSHQGLAFHSIGDSQKATSFHDGYISIVVPNFGRGVRLLSECAVYEFHSDFHALPSGELSRRFMVAEQIVELMPVQVGVKQETLWSGLSRKLKSIVPKRP